MQLPIVTTKNTFLCFWQKKGFLRKGLVANDHPHLEDEAVVLLHSLPGLELAKSERGVSMEVDHWDEELHGHPMLKTVYFKRLEVAQ